MRHIKTLSTCLVALALQSAAWAEIYETTDAQGNTEFTDSPPAPGAEAINLQQTNIIDAPPESPQQDEEVSAPQPVVDQAAPEQENQTVIIHDRDDDEDQLYDADLRRERAFNQMDPDAPREVGDSDSQMPRQIGDSASQMPDEVGDFDRPNPVRDGAELVPEEGVAPARHGVVHPNHR